jgi:hypothetical protein
VERDLGRRSGGGSGSTQLELDVGEGRRKWIGTTRGADKSGARRARIAGACNAWRRLVDGHSRQYGCRGDTVKNREE